MAILNQNVWWSKLLVAFTILPLLFGTGSAAQAAGTLPEGGVIVDGYGTGAIGKPTDVDDPRFPDDPDKMMRQLVVEQESQRLIIDWDSFSIGADARVLFEQQHGADAVVLNRVTTAHSSTIDGMLSASGQVFLINPNGVLFGANAVVNTGGLAASTLSLSNDDFWLGNYSFNRNGAVGGIVNRGEINALPGGYVAFIAPVVTNEATGSLRAYLGTVAVGAGDKASLYVLGDGLVHLQIDAPVADAADPLVINDGLIETYGGLTLVTAAAHNGFVGAVISQEGSVRAATAEAKDGRIVLSAGGRGDVAIGADAVVAATGDIDISAGGDIVIAGTITRPRNEEGMLETDEDRLNGSVTLHAGTAMTGDGSVTFAGAGEIDFARRPDDDAELVDTGNVVILYNPVGSETTHKYMNTIDYGSSGVPGAIVLDEGSLAAYMLVNDLNDLKDIRENMDGDYALGQHIDASATEQGTAWFRPLSGSAGAAFTGTLDGRGHVIERLRVCGDSGCSDPTAANVGLFAAIGSTGRVRSLGLQGVNVMGTSVVGALAGVNEGLVSRVYVTGSVSGIAHDSGGTVSGGDVVGGLVGRNIGQIEDAYSVAAVSGRAKVGGLVGELSGAGELRRTYSTGSVTRTGTGNESSIGGLVGGTTGAGGSGTPKIVASFWGVDDPGNREVVGDVDGLIGTPKQLTTAQMQSAGFWLSDEWNEAAAWDVDSTGHADAAGSRWRLYDGETGPLLKDFLQEIVVSGKPRTIEYDGDEHGLNEVAFSLPDIQIGTDIYGAPDFGATYRDAGEYLINVGGLHSTGQRGYDIRYAPSLLTIDPRSVTVRVDANQSKIYGEDDPNLADFEFGFGVAFEFDKVEGDDVQFTGRLYRALGEDAGAYAIGLDDPEWDDEDEGASPARLASNNPNYVISTFVGADFTIEKRPIKVTVSKAEHEKTYGQEYVLGGMDEENGWKLIVDADKGWYDLVAGDSLSGALSSVGSSEYANVLLDDDGELDYYGIHQGSLGHDNYEIVEFVEGKLFVNKAPLTVKVNDYERVYGNWAPTPTLHYDGLVLGQTGVTWDSLRFDGEPEQYAGVGVYDVTPQGTTKNNNYTIAFDSGKATIRPRPIVVTVVSPDDKQYGDELQARDIDLVITYDGPETPDGDEEALVNGDELGGAVHSDGFAADANVKWENDDVAAYAIGQGTLGGANANYDIRFVPGEFNVLPVRLTVTTMNEARHYGDVNPVFDATFEGFRLNQDGTALGGQLEFDGIPGTTADVGTYTVTPKGLTSGNYTIEFVPGTLSIQRRPVDVRLVKPLWEKLYGEAIDPNEVLWAVDADALVADDTLHGVVASDGFAGNAPVLLDEWGEVVPYSIGRGTMTNANNPNYDINFIIGELTIKQAALTITALNNERVYGDTLLKNPFAVTFDGFRPGDDETMLDGILGFVARDRLTPVGEYELLPTGLHSNNYAITFKPGTLTITRRPVEVSLLNPNLTKQYGDVFAPHDAQWFVSKGNLVGDDELTGAPASPGFAAAASVRDADGNLIVYTVGQGDLNNGNYDITFVPGTLTLNPAPLDVIAGNVTRYYGESNPEIPVSYRGFKLGEDENSLGGELFLSTVGETADVLIGGYSITPGGLTSGNYAIRYTRGTLTIEPAPLKATVLDAWRYYGDPNPQFEMVYEGFTLGQDEQALSGRLSVDGPGQTVPADANGYVITPGGLRSGNYKIEFVPGTIVVKPAPLKITALDVMRRYGSPNPNFAASYDGLKLGETPAALDGQLTIATAATRHSLAGRYALIPSGQTGSNYDISYVNGTLTVFVAPGDVEWPAAMREAYGAAQSGINALAAFGGLNLDCVDPGDDVGAEGRMCSAFGGP